MIVMAEFAYGFIEHSPQPLPVRIAWRLDHVLHDNALLLLGTTLAFGSHQIARRESRTAAEPPLNTLCCESLADLRAKARRAKGSSIHLMPLAALAKFSPRRRNSGFGRQSVEVLGSNGLDGGAAEIRDIAGDDASGGSIFCKRDDHGVLEVRDG